MYTNNLSFILTYFGSNVVSIFSFRIHLETTENAFVDVVNKDNSKTEVITKPKCS